MRIYQTTIETVPDALLTEAADSWLVDAFDAALAFLESGGNKIVADADFGDMRGTATPTTPRDVSTKPTQAPQSAGSLS